MTWEIARNHFALGALNEDELIDLLNDLGDDSELVMFLVVNHFKVKPISQKMLVELSEYSGTKLAHHILKNNL